MAINSLAEITPLINRQIDSQELLNEYLAKIQALVCITSCEDFLDYERSIIHSYLWALGDLVTDAKKLSEEALNVLLKDSRSLGYR